MKICPIYIPRFPSTPGQFCGEGQDVRADLKEQQSGPARTQLTDGHIIPQKIMSKEVNMGKDL